MPTAGPVVRRRLSVYIVLASFVVLLAGGGFAAFESRQVSNYGEGLWWALSLMTTVGFVGEVPESVVGRLLSSVLMVTGFSLMALVTAAISSFFVHEERLPDELAEEEFAAQALAMLTDLSRRLAVIEAGMSDLPAEATDGRGAGDGSVAHQPTDE
jgi:voltage-gated potassium channel